MILAMAQLPFFYGWVVVAVAFVTMAVGVNARTGMRDMRPATARTLRGAANHIAAADTPLKTIDSQKANA